FSLLPLSLTFLSSSPPSPYIPASLPPPPIPTSSPSHSVPLVFPFPSIPIPLLHMTASVRPYCQRATSYCPRPFRTASSLFPTLSSAPPLPSLLSLPVFHPAPHFSLPRNLDIKIPLPTLSFSLPTTPLIPLSLSSQNLITFVLSIFTSKSLSVINLSPSSNINSKPLTSSASSVMSSAYSSSNNFVLPSLTPPFPLILSPL
ncbi:uncharacterized protein, partial [Prorops nasuta]|uniref:uncharacterized protein n=1 Tax=Prorops nasuta TaxID=863751 RepID=UPI0034CF6B22